MKHVALSSLFIFLIFILAGQSCTFVASKISQEQDASIASKLPDPKIENFKYSELPVLKRLLEDQLDKYQIGLGYLKKAANLYEGNEGIVHDRRVAEVEILLNMLLAQVKNLSLYYPEHWENERSQLKSSFQRLKELYEKAYQGLV